MLRRGIELETLLTVCLREKKIVTDPYLIGAVTASLALEQSYLPGLESTHWAVMVWHLDSR